MKDEFHIPEAEMVEDVDLNELFPRAPARHTELPPCAEFLILADGIIEDSDLDLLFDGIEDAPLRAPSTSVDEDETSDSEKDQDHETSEDNWEPETATTDQGTFTVRPHPAHVKVTAEALGIETEVPTYLELILSLVKQSTLKQKLVTFISQKPAQPDVSLVPLDSFDGVKDRKVLDTHCPRLKQRLDKFCKEIEEVSRGEVDIPAMAAPSGPLRSHMTFVWHYPTSQDRDEPVRTTIRHHSIPQQVRPKGKIEESFSNWNEMEKTCLDFAKDLLSESRVIVVMGEAQFSDVERILKSQGLTIKSLQVNVEEKMFGKAARSLGL
ncbi:hypothetical protein NM208_g4521 [Fusarium decemcellulare]|uniref:Uncharacterized protein n=1 Tax=Fusarium decemcellulare TaxID=57161 RepID=A0ACC1SKG9_9HYPO|nr:hypothetical protein NM208_g4521 [Fusarium decemcellulare]